MTFGGENYDITRSHVQEKAEAVVLWLFWCLSSRVFLRQIHVPF